MPRIPQSAIDAMIQHAREELPNEACGMLHARDGEVVAVHRVTNRAASPYRYELEPLEQLKLERSRDDSGETLLAIYHSHVASPARPSPTDVRQAFFPPGEIDGAQMFPDSYYILVSLAEDAPDVRAYRISAVDLDGRTFDEAAQETIEEEPIEVVP
jgi:proteasome lid subunit RPN8/RPN11